MKKHKILKVILTAAAVLTAVAGCYLWTSFNGNPLSKHIVKNTCLKYIDETYPNEDYEIASVEYSFKEGAYLVNVKSPSSEDSYFSVYFTGTGKLIYDSYEFMMNGENTARRLDEVYRQMCNEIYESEDFRYDCDIFYGTLRIGDVPEAEYNMPSYLPYSALQADCPFDISYAKDYGHICMYIYTENNYSQDDLCTELTKIRNMFNACEVPFNDIELVIQDLDTHEELYHLMHYRYADIDVPNMAEIVQENIENTKQYFNDMDQMKTEEMDAAEQ